MTIDARRPFTEIFEVSQKELVREGASGQEAKYKGFVNQVYLNDLIAVLPERYIKKEGYITTQAEYTTGTVIVGSGTAGVKGASTVWTSAYTNNLMAIDGADITYRVTYSAATLMTFNNSLTWTASSSSGNTYTMYADRYSLASDFNYMVTDDADNPKNVYRWVGGTKAYMAPMENNEFDKVAISDTGDLHSYTVKYVDSSAYMYLASGSSAADILGYEYIPVLSEMIEYTTGTITLIGGTVVIGSGTLWSTALDSTDTYYLRNDADGTGSNSKWFKVSSIDDATTITLSSSFTYTSGTGILYTISGISKWPARYDDAILYKTSFLVDPDGVQAEKFIGVYQEAVGLDLATESKRRTTSKFKKFPGVRR